MGFYLNKSMKMAGNGGKIIETEEAEFNGLTIKKGAKVTSANVEGQSFPNLQGLKQLIATEGIESGEVKVEGAKMETLNYTQKEDKDLVKKLPQKTKTKKFCINNLKLEEDTEINVLNVKNAESSQRNSESNEQDQRNNETIPNDPIVEEDLS